METLLSLLLLVTIVLWALVFRSAVSDRRLRFLLNCVSVIYLVPPLLLVNGFQLSDPFAGLRMHEADLAWLGIKAVLLTSLANAFCLAGVMLGRTFSDKFEGARVDRFGVSLAKWFTVTCVVSLYLYASAIGGLVELFTTVLIYKRGDELVYTELSFLKQLVTVGAASWLLLADRARETRSFTMRLWATVALLAGGGALFIQGGRLSVFLYLAPLYLLLPRAGKVLALVALPAAALIIFHPERLLFAAADVQGELDYWEAARGVISDFFPAAANAYWLPLWDVDILRLFRDVVMVPIALLPKRVLDLGDYQGEAIALFKIIDFPNAVDLIGFGLLSLSAAGVALWAFVYGLILQAIARVARSLDAVGYSLSAFGLTVYFAFRPMYFSPQHFVFTFMAFIPLLYAVTRLRPSPHREAVHSPTS